MKAQAAALQAANITSVDAAQLNTSARFSTDFVRVDDQGRIQVYVIVAASDATTSTLENIIKLGDVQIDYPSDPFEIFQGLATIQAWVLYTKLEALAALPAVRTIRPPGYGATE